MHRRLLALVPACFALTACRSEPDFDTQFEKTQQELDQRASAMESRIDSRLDQPAQAKQGPRK
ncbi:MAG: hypothetical protein AB7F98_02400 [Novosphingobium sp.]